MFGARYLDRRRYHRAKHDLQEQVFDAVTVQRLVIGLVEVAKQAIVTGCLASLLSVFGFAEVRASLGVEVAKRQGCTSNSWPRGWIFDQLSQNSRTAFRRFI